ncbi:MAG: CDP-glucose 4,6-dehydratase [Lachnospiraceae bacterium]|nr:CDP-glucose 4,6-dehydratase [Candidatus Colinaster equi]
MDKRDLASFYKGKRVLLTGHTGFKGTWMCAVLKSFGAEVTGYALDAPTTPSLYDMTCMSEGMNDIRGDIRDLDSLKAAFEVAKPQIVLHMAAQPLVRASYDDPVGTYDTNVMGTVNVMECCRLAAANGLKSVVNITTDKVYRNTERAEGYKEDEELCGYDPYSNSKSCSELVTDSYRNSFLRDAGVAVSTVRAGNVIGGGDFAKDRIIPDCVRAMEKGEDIIVRNPFSTRPYQHVLEPLMAYLLVAAMQYDDMTYASAYNVGPDDEDCLTTGELVTLFCDKWSQVTGTKATWINKHDGGPHEAGLLKLDSTKLKNTFGWRPVWHMDTVMTRIVEWTKVYIDGGDVTRTMQEQIGEFVS